MCIVRIKGKNCFKYYVEIHFGVEKNGVVD